MKASMRAQPAEVIAADAARVNEQELALDKDSFPLDRYKPIYELGAGASGVVYLARDRVLGKKVAIKILRSLSPSIVIGFQEEARTTSRLKHKYIVDLLDFGVTSKGAPYMVLEFVLGPSLEEVVQRVGPLNLRDFFSVFERACEALSYAHANKVFHRDLKPGNILLTNETDGSFSIRVIDFGLAKILSDQADADQNKQLTLVGTPLYMSPDQGLGRRFDARSEVYSLGCVMFEALTGLPPFEADTALELLNLHAEEEPPRLIDVLLAQGAPPETTVIPEPIESLVRRCLEKEPKDRFQSVSEVHAALIAAQQHSYEERDEDLGEAVVKSNQSLLWIVGGIALLVGLSAVVYVFVSGVNFATEKNSDSHPIIDRTSVDLQFAGAAPMKSLERLIDPNQEVIRLSGALKASEIVGLDRYKNMVDLDLSNNVHGDDVTAQINGKYLKVLKLNNTPVTTLEYVSKLKSLQNLNLASSSIDGNAVKRLRNLPNLVGLDVRDTPLKEDDLKYLDIPSLLKLSVSRERYSPEALSALNKRMPACDMGIEPHRVVLLDQVRDLISARKFVDAEKHAKQAIRVIEGIQGKDSPPVSAYAYWAGDAALHLHRFEDAESFFKRAIDVAIKTNFKIYLPDSYTKLMQVYDETERRTLANDYVERAIEARKERDGYTNDGAHLTVRAGEKHLWKSDWAGAEKWFAQSQNYIKNLRSRNFKFPDSDDVLLFGPLDLHFSEVCFNTGRYEESKSYAIRARKLLTKHPATKKNEVEERLQNQLLSVCETRLAASASHDKQFDEAIRHQQAAIDFRRRSNLPTADAVQYLDELKRLSARELNEKK